MVEQLPDGDALTARDDATQPVPHVVVKSQLALGDQLEHHGDYERLGYAADAEPVCGPGRAPGGQVALAANPLPGRLAGADQRDGAGGAGLHDLIHQPREGCRIRSWLGGGRCRGAGGGGGRVVPRP
jgi:hypothetical protein